MKPSIAVRCRMRVSSDNARCHPKPIAVAAIIAAMASGATRRSAISIAWLPPGRAGGSIRGMEFGSRSAGADIDVRQRGSCCGMASPSIHDARRPSLQSLPFDGLFMIAVDQERKRNTARDARAGAWPPVALTSPGPLPYKPRTFSLGGPGAAAGVAFDFSVPSRGIIGPDAAISGEQTGEADLSTEQTGAQASPRLSRPDGHKGRPQGRQCPPRARSQAPQRLTQRGRRPASLPWNA